MGLQGLACDPLMLSQQVTCLGVAQAVCERRRALDESRPSTESPAPETKIPASLVEGLGTPGTLPRWIGSRNLMVLVSRPRGARVLDRGRNPANCGA